MTPDETRAEIARLQGLLNGATLTATEAGATDERINILGRMLHAAERCPDCGGQKGMDNPFFGCICELQAASEAKASSGPESQAASRPTPVANNANKKTARSLKGEK